MPSSYSHHMWLTAGHMWGVLLQMHMLTSAAAMTKPRVLIESPEGVPLHCGVGFCGHTSKDGVLAHQSCACVAKKWVLACGRASHTTCGLARNQLSGRQLESTCDLQNTC